MVVKTTLPLLLVLLITLVDATSSSLRRVRSLVAADDDGFCATDQYVENGFDYEGNDLTNVPSVPSTACCQACRDYAGCKAWSWSTYNNGTCWLKSDRGRAIANRYVRSALVVPNGKTLETCGLHVDVDFVGNDIGGVGCPSAERCIPLCRSYPGCRAFAWTSQDGGTCWLKTAQGQAIVKKGVVSGVGFYSFTCAPVCALDYNADYAGNDIGSAPSLTATGCCAICATTKNCRAYAWTNQNSGTCWLKNHAGPGVSKNGVTSAVVFPNPVCDIEEGVDIVGKDIANVLNTDPGACCSICFDRPDCNAYTWSNYQGGTCWLKSGKGPTVQNAQTKSGVVRRA